MVGLGDLPGGHFESQALGVTANGTVVIGHGKADTRRAFIWTEASGIRSVEEVLEGDCALDLTGWTLSFARGISYDGTVIVGLSQEGNSNGVTEAWRAGGLR